MLTQSRLKEVFKYCPETGLFIRIMKTCNRVRVGDIADTHSEGYILLTVDSKRYKAHRLAWLYMKGYLPENRIDHKDRIRDNNKWKNLREASNQCNSRNTGNYRSNTSGVKGVSFFTRDMLWKSQIRVNYKNIHLGYHEDFDEAVCCRLAAEQAENWAGCDSSSPAFKHVQKMVNRNG